MDPLTLLIIGHLIGSVLGVGGATFIEIFLNKALRDGEINPTEGSFLKATFTTVRVGLLISLVTGIGLILLYRFADQSFRLYDPTLWAKFTIIGVIVVNALLLQAHKIPIWLGSPLSFVSWYSVLVIGVLLRGPSVPYFEVLFYYSIALVLGGLILEGIRRGLGIKL